MTTTPTIIQLLETRLHEASDEVVYATENYEAELKRIQTMVREELSLMGQGFGHQKSGWWGPRGVALELAATRLTRAHEEKRKAMFLVNSAGALSAI